MEKYGKSEAGYIRYYIIHAGTLPSATSIHSPCQRTWKPRSGMTALIRSTQSLGTMSSKPHLGAAEETTVGGRGEDGSRRGERWGQREGRLGAEGWKYAGRGMPAEEDNTCCCILAKNSVRMIS